MNIKSKLKTQCNLLRARNLLTSVPSQIDGSQFLESSCFGCFKCQTLFPMETHSLLTHVSWRSMVYIILLVMDGLKLIRLFYLILVHELSKLWILRHLSSLTMDGPKLLWDLGTLVSSLLLHVQSDKVRAPFWDQTAVDPLHCDPKTTISPPP